jgi:hypothetical protein
MAAAGLRLRPMALSSTHQIPFRAARRRARPANGQQYRWLRAASIVSFFGCMVVALLWHGTRRLPWLGPLIADGLRATVGVEAVISLEETVAALEDEIRLRLYSDAEPEDYSSVLPASLEQAGDAILSSAPRAFPPPLSLRRSDPSSPKPRSGALDRGPAQSFRPDAISPMFHELASPLDGKWMPIAERSKAGGSSSMHLTLLHPDRRRPYAELFVIAIDLDRTRLYAVPGTREPWSTAGGPGKYRRNGLVPNRDQGKLLGAFNGGFKTVHDQYGMAVDGITLVPPRHFACTIAAGRNGELKVRTWKRLETPREDFSWWRQTPPCLYENGQLHPGLKSDDSRAWGAALKGNTVIRRSALGLSRNGRTLYVGISNATTARTLAAGMHHAGAWDVAQLDINWSYPKFAVFRENPSGQLQASSLIGGFTVQPDDYLRAASPRDFFYLVRSD